LVGVDKTRGAVGDPAVVMADVACEVSAELLIVGRARRPVTPTLLGSFAQRVVEQPTCDVLVVGWDPVPSTTVGERPRQVWNPAVGSPMKEDPNRDVRPGEGEEGAGDDLDALGRAGGADESAVGRPAAAGVEGSPRRAREKQPVAKGAPRRGEETACSLVVFAPSPILTITIEAEADGQADIHLHAGGQGFWVARMAVSLGAQVSLCCALGGETGRVLRALMGAEGVDIQSVESGASNGAYIHDRRSGERIEVAFTPAGHLGRHDVDELYGITLASGLDADVTLLSGVQPEQILDADVYRRLAGDLRANDRVVIADLTGAPLAAALAGGLAVLKLSQEELLAERGTASDDVGDVLKAMRGLKRAGAESVLLSRGPVPALVLDGEHETPRALELSGPRFEAADPIGSGDSMFAALGVGLGSGSGLVDALKVAVAAGALNATRRGLGTGTPDESAWTAAHQGAMKCLR
jgi:1-phosphofructokinase